MPSTTRTGRSKKHTMGFVAVGYSSTEDFWYSSEGVFAKPEAAVKDLKHLYPVDFAYAVEVPLMFPTKSKGLK